VVTSVTVPDTVLSSDDFDLQVTMKNNGPGSTLAGHSWYSVVYASTDNTLSSDDKELGRAMNNRALAADSSFAQVITASVPAATGVLRRVSKAQC